MRTQADLDLSEVAMGKRKATKYSMEEESKKYMQSCKKKKKLGLFGF